MRSSGDCRPCRLWFVRMWALCGIGIWSYLPTAWGGEPVVTLAPVLVWISDEPGGDSSEVIPVQFQDQPSTGVAAQQPAVPSAPTLASRALDLGLSAALGELGDDSALGVGIGVNATLQAKFRATTDAGDLLGKAPSALGVVVQKRTPIVGFYCTTGRKVS